MSDRITLENGTEVYIVLSPRFMGNRVRLHHRDAPPEVSDVEVGRIVEADEKSYLQLPGVVFGMSPDTLRAIADLLEGGH